MEARNPEIPLVFTPSNLVTLSPLPSPIHPRRLSRRFAKPYPPITRHNQPTMAWVSLQGRLIGADEATSAPTVDVKGRFSPKEAVCWELFSPIHRVLIVAVVAVAASMSDKNRHILQLQKCVHLRDQVLLSMQQKLDALCDQMTCIKDQPQSMPHHSTNSDSVSTHCWLCDQHRAQLADLSGNSLVKAGSMDEMFGSRLSVTTDAEQEERRMSDLSDWTASSVTSAADAQLNNLAFEQDTYNMKKECEEKDAAIKELSAFIRSKDVVTSKRIEDLEEIIRCKNSMITRLRKDMLVLEQKVVSLTRMRRRSFPGPNIEKKQLPTMTDNLIYDMDSPTSTSDSDCSSIAKHPSSEKTDEVSSGSALEQRSFTLENEDATKRHRQSAPPKVPCASLKHSCTISMSRPVTPLKEKSMNEGQNPSASPRIKQNSANAGPRNSRRRSTPNVSKERAATSKRWM